MSQPALSASIAKLERELNVTLINRGHNYLPLRPFPLPRSALPILRHEFTSTPDCRRQS